jgi:hypothetical protein
MYSSWNTAVAVVVGLTAGPCKPLNLVAFRVMYKGEIGIAVTPCRVAMVPRIMEPRANPVLEVELLIGPVYPVD